MRGLRVAWPAGMDVLTAGVCLTLGVVLYLVGMHSLFGRGPDVALPWLLAPLVLGCAGQLWRSTLPDLALGVGVLAVAADATHGTTLPVLIVLADLLYAATLHGSRRLSRWLVAAAGVAAVAVTVLGAALTRDWRLAVSLPLQVGVLVVIPVWWGRSVRQHRELAAAERERAELDRRAAVAEERSRMARDLHDVVAGQLSAIAIQSEALLSGSTADSGTVLRSVRENSLAALHEMRTMIDVLQGEDVDPRTAPATFDDVAALVETARASGLDVDADVRLSPGVSPATELAAYRIVQEALTNAARHAPGATASVRVTAGDLVVVDVRNDVTGEPGDPGTGLVSMRERAQAVGGTFTAGRDGGRWRVRAELPAGGRP